VPVGADEILAWLTRLIRSFLLWRQCRLFWGVCPQCDCPPVMNRTGGYKNILNELNWEMPVSICGVVYSEVQCNNWLKTMFLFLLYDFYDQWFQAWRLFLPVRGKHDIFIFHLDTTARSPDSTGQILFVFYEIYRVGDSARSRINFALKGILVCVC
jgi:hypothetical protein